MFTFPQVQSWLREAQMVERRRLRRRHQPFRFTAVAIAAIATPLTFCAAQGTLWSYWLGAGVRHHIAQRRRIQCHDSKGQTTSPEDLDPYLQMTSDLDALLKELRPSVEKAEKAAKAPRRLKQQSTGNMTVIMAKTLEGLEDHMENTTKAAAGEVASAPVAGEASASSSEVLISSTDSALEEAEPVEAAAGEAASALVAGDASASSSEALFSSTDTALEEAEPVEVDSVEPDLEASPVMAVTIAEKRTAEVYAVPGGIALDPMKQFAVQPQQLIEYGLRPAPEYGNDAFIVTLGQLDHMVEFKMQAIQGVLNALNRYVSDLEQELRRAEVDLKQANTKLDEEHVLREKAESELRVALEQRAAAEAAVVTEQEALQTAEKKVQDFDLQVTQIRESVERAEISKEEGDRLYNEVRAEQVASMSSKEEAQALMDQELERLQEAEKATEEARQKAEEAARVEAILRRELEEKSSLLQQLQAERDEEARKRADADARFYDLVHRLQSKRGQAGQSASS